MGVYRAVRADEYKIVLVHEPESDQSHLIEIRNPKASWTPTIVEGKRYTVSLSVSEVTWPNIPPVVEQLPNTAENERRITASESTGDTPEPAAVEDALEAVSPAAESVES